MSLGKFDILCRSKECAARTGLLHTSHGTVRTPVFMPVGTQGSVKGISNEELEKAGAQIILGNSYHLYLRPGHELVRLAGGLNRFTGWKKPMLTDSGGFQIFSLATLRKIESDGVEFKSHLDGSKHFFTPEISMDIQTAIGADIIMCFDECPPYPSTFDYAQRSMNLSLEWAKRCKTSFEGKGGSEKTGQLLFGIIQGSVYPELRKESTEKMVDIGFPGYAIGGVSVGEPHEEMVKVVENTAPLIPEEKPRYLMGMGTPLDIWEAVERGIDMFDCVLPTRNGRNGQALTSVGKVNIRNVEYQKDFSPLDPNCNCPVCQGYSRAYLCHLVRAQELLVLRLLSLHNIYFMLQLMGEIQKSIETGRFFERKTSFLRSYQNNQTVEE